MTDDQLDGSHYDRDQEVICTVIPNDGTDDGDAVSSSALTISNTEPYIGSVSIDPDDPQVTDTWTAVMAFGDDDGDEENPLIVGPSMESWSAPPMNSLRIRQRRCRDLHRHAQRWYRFAQRSLKTSPRDRDIGLSQIRPKPTRQSRSV